MAKLLQCALLFCCVVGAACLSPDRTRVLPDAVFSDEIRQSASIDDNGELGECRYAIRMFMLQDISHSFNDDLPNIRRFLPEFVPKLTERYPFSQVAFGSFSDVPFPDVGFGAFDPRDKCFNLDVPFTSNHERLQYALDRIRLLSGRDFAEAQFMALHHVAVADYFGKRKHTPEGRPIVPLIVVSTDAEAHVAGDLAKELRWHPHYWTRPEFRILFGEQDEMPKYEVVPNDGDPIMRCGQNPFDRVFEDYPTIEQIGLALAKLQGVVLFLCTEDVVDFYVRFAKELGERYGVLAIVDTISSDSSDVADLLGAAVTELDRLVCIPTSTTTTTTTTTTSTTTDKTTTSGFRCDGDAALDLMYIQDVTHSYKNDLDNVRSLLSGVLAHTLDVFLEPRWGVASFADRPVAPLGSARSGDYCFKMHQSLTDDVGALVGSLYHITIHSGLDWRECQLDAMISAVMRPEALWRDDVINVDGEDVPVLRVVAIATDSGYHVRGDGKSVGLVENNPLTGFIDERATEYPLPEEVVAVFKAKKMVPIFLVTDDLRRKYLRFARQFEAAGLPVAVATLAEDSSDIVSALKTALAELCDESKDWRRRLLEDWRRAHLA